MITEDIDWDRQCEREKRERERKREYVYKPFVLHQWRAGRMQKGQGSTKCEGKAPVHYCQYTDENYREIPNAPTNETF